MKQFLAVLSIIFVQIITFGQETPTLEFPDYITGGCSFEAEVINGDSLDSVMFNGSYIPVLRDGDRSFIETEVSSVSEIKVEGATVGNTPKVIPGWMSILPPVIAIFLALILKEVMLSLFLGIFSGAAIISIYTDGISGIFSAFLSVLDTYMMNALADTDHLSVILFSLTIGVIVAIISKNGGMQGVVNHIVKFAKNRRSGMLSTYFLGIAIFFDDYANTLVVGNTMRSVTDKLRISREKLAYIVDSTAAPVAAIAFVTTWIGAELGYISSGVDKINAAYDGGITEGSYSIFVNSLAYSFYPIITLFFMYFLIRRDRDFGPMRKFELQAIEKGVDGGGDNDESTLDLKEFDPVDENNTKSFNAIIPIAIVIFGTLIGLVYTGLQSWESTLTAAGISTQDGVWNAMSEYPNGPASVFQKLGAIIGDANSYAALLWSSITAAFVALFMTIGQRIMNLQDTMETVLMGIKTMLPAIIILVMAWSLAQITDNLDTADYIKGLFGADFKQVWIVPALTFIISAVIAFSTGSSWSTMALIYPVMIPTAFAVSIEAGIDGMPILYNTVACVLAGSVLGDHCSPISDTTILSSLATSCNHINHVQTQMPYALTVGAISLFIGIIPGAMGVPSYITIPVGIGVAYLVVQFFGKPNPRVTQS